MKVLLDNNPILLEISEPIEDILAEDIQTLVKDLIATSMEIGGYGLAAPQVGINKQIFVYRKSIFGNKYKVVINPQIVVKSGKKMSRNEGCLSYPEFRTDIKRAKTFILKGYNQFGESIRIKGTTAVETRVLQHEYDHLQGITIKTKE